MPGSPRLGKSVIDNPMPKTEVLGTIKTNLFTDPTPLGSDSVSQLPDGTQVSVAEPPPPWELDPKSQLSLSDARRFVSVPDNWVLRWINPRLLDQDGWRDWRPVMQSDPLVRVKVHTMVSPEGNIRRGGATGDILAWMYRSWVESRRRELLAMTEKQTQAAADNQEQLREDFRRGKYGRNVALEGAKHPTHTQVEGRTLKD